MGPLGAQYNTASNIRVPPKKDCSFDNLNLVTLHIGRCEPLAYKGSVPFGGVWGRGMCL